MQSSERILPNRMKRESRSVVRVQKEMPRKVKEGAPRMCEKMIKGEVHLEEIHLLTKRLLPKRTELRRLGNHLRENKSRR